MNNALRNWSMATLMLVAVLLYGAAITGWPRPLAGEKTTLRLEPIIFSLIGYYFGRLPSWQNEKNLRGEIDRHAHRADAAQHAKEQAQQSREALEEKLKNARAALAPEAALPPNGAAAERERAQVTVREAAVRLSVVTALHILDS